ncbi:putative protein OS=Streptomyces griseomycini OX=66895 GN=FHS37_003337 PE=4 SV=1 [Streptomyces griseomycini]
MRPPHQEPEPILLRLLSVTDVTAGVGHCQSLVLLYGNDHQSRRSSVIPVRLTPQVIAEAAPAATGADQFETSTAHQAVVNASDQHPGRASKTRALHELLGMPTDEATVSITRGRLGRLSRLSRQGFLTRPGRDRYRKRSRRPLSWLESARPTAATLA